MTQEKLQSIEKILLLLTIVLLPFVTLPKRMIINTVGGNATNYTILALCIVFAVEVFKFRPKIKSVFVKFFIIFTLARIITLAIGLINYPYYDLITIDQIDKLQVLVNKIPALGDGKNLLPYWLFIREAKNIFMDNFTLLGLPVIIWHLFHTDWQAGFKYMRKAVLILVVIFGTYSFIEILWLKLHLGIAKDILRFVNPLLYDPKSAHGWWPPLLWNGQLRSVCPEPSFFGIYASFCIPFLWSYIVDERKTKDIVLYTYFMLMLFLTKARTGLGIFIGEYVLLVLSTLFCRSKKIFLILGIVSLSSIIAFSMTLVDWKSGNEAISAETYISENVTSVTKANARSNEARFINIRATFDVAKRHFFWGVGNNLKNAYIPEYLSEEDYKNYEVALWTRFMYEKGILKSGYPNLNQYINTFVDCGVLGLLLFIAPIVYVLIGLKNNWQRGKFDINMLFASIIFVAQLVSMIANKYHITYPLALGLCLCVVENSDGKNTKGVEVQ